MSDIIRDINEIQENHKDMPQKPLSHELGKLKEIDELLQHRTYRNYNKKK